MIIPKLWETSYKPLLLKDFKEQPDTYFAGWRNQPPVRRPGSVEACMCINEIIWITRHKIIGIKISTRTRSKNHFSI